MIRSMNLLSSSDKTDLIMSRYRPIAPKPQYFPPATLIESPPNVSSQNPPPILTNFSHLQSKSCAGSGSGRKRNRGGTSYAPNTTTPHKRVRTRVGDSVSEDTKLGLSLHGFGHGFGWFHENPNRYSGDLVTLPLLPCACTEEVKPFPQKEEVVDLNSTPEVIEKDFLKKLQVPLPGTKMPGCVNVIIPRPVRAVGSTISVGCIREKPHLVFLAPLPKRAEEVEEEVESEMLPSVISDSNNRVRLANAAYKEMVGQPECSWLDSVAASKRLSGEVMLDLVGSAVPFSSNGFSCKAKIEWASNGQKIFVSAPCDVIKLSCKSKDYLFTWRFHTSEDFGTKA